MITPFRCALAAFALTAFGAAHASEITQFPLDKGSRTRAEVRAELPGNPQQVYANELYDGSTAGEKTMGTSMRSRADVRREAAMRRTPLDATWRHDGD